MRIKLNVIASTVRDKRVILVDDSIVRGHDDSPHSRAAARGRGEEVHVRLSAPPFLYPCYFGTDIDSRENLIAAQHSIEEIREIIGVDSIGYLSCENVHKLPTTRALTSAPPASPATTPARYRSARRRAALSRS